jgi:hypothetical protein
VLFRLGFVVHIAFPHGDETQPAHAAAPTQLG